MTFRKIFISHATKDGSLVSLLQDFLIDTFKIDEGDIYCTSNAGTIPTGERFVEHMRTHLENAKLVMLLLTESYFESNFCLAEMGAAWVLNQSIYPIVFKPFEYNVLESTPLKGVQAKRIETRDAVLAFYDEFRNHGLVETISSVRLNRKIDEFVAALPDIISSTPEEPQTISIEKYEEFRKDYDDITEELADSQRRYRDLEAKYHRLEEAKDHDEVAAIKYEGMTDESKFNEYVENLYALLNKQRRILVSTIYNEQYRRRYEFWINGDEYPRDWEHLMEYEANKVLRVDWDRGRIVTNDSSVIVKRIMDALKDLEKFLSDEASPEFYEWFFDKYDFELDVSLKKFWEDVLNQDIFIAR